MTNEITINASDIEFAAVLVAIFGPDEALEILQEAYDANYGFRGKMEDVRRAVKGSQASSTLKEVALKAHLFGAYKAHVFHTALAATIAAIESGAAEEHLLAEHEAQQGWGSTIVPPAMPETANPIADKAEVEKWIYATLNPWWEGLDELVQRQAPKQLRQLQEEARALVNERLLIWFVLEMRNVSSFEEAKAFLTEVRYKVPEEIRNEGLKVCPFGWELVADESLYLFLPPAMPDPSTQLASRLPLLALAKWAMGGSVKLPWLARELGKRFPMKENQVVPLEGYLIHPNGSVTEGSRYLSGPFLGQIVSSVPSPDGWFDVKGLRWLDGKIFHAMERLKKVQRGKVDLSNVIGGFGHHPKLGYPRLIFQLGAGSGRAGFEMPVWRPIQGEGWLAQQLEDIQLLQGAGIPVPADAYWMNVQVGKTKAGNPRLEPVFAGKEAVSAVLFYGSGSAMSQGRHGWTPSRSRAQKGTEQNGARVLWSGFASSRGGGVNSSADLVWLPEGSSVALSGGESITFDGTEVKVIPGGSLSPEDDPSRN